VVAIFGVTNRVAYLCNYICTQRFLLLRSCDMRKS